MIFAIEISDFNINFHIIWETVFCGPTLLMVYCLTFMMISTQIFYVQTDELLLLLLGC